VSVTNWERIKSLAGKNEEFAGRLVYCYGSFRNMTKQWFLQFVQEAQDRSFEVLVTRGVVYVLTGEE